MTCHHISESQRFAREKNWKEEDPNPSSLRVIYLTIMIITVTRWLKLPSLCPQVYKLLLRMELLDGMREMNGLRTGTITSSLFHFFDMITFL